MFITETKRLKDVYKICTSLLSREVKDEIAYFIAVRSFVMKTTREGVPDLKEVNKRISDMLEQAIISDKVLSLTEAGTKETFELLTDENLNKLKKLPQKNVAANILMRVMKEKIDDVRKTNLVISKTFGERLERIIERYNNRKAEEDVYEVLEELVKFKHELLDAIEKGHQVGLTYEEKAFFDVLTSDPEVIKEMGDDILIKIARELTKTVKQNMTHAWYEKAQAQAKMRSEIKRLLKKYDYPPNKSKKAIEDVLEQARLQCVNA